MLRYLVPEHYRTESLICFQIMIDVKCRGSNIWVSQPGTDQVVWALILSASICKYVPSHGHQVVFAGK